MDCIGNNVHIEKLAREENKGEPSHRMHYMIYVLDCKRLDHLCTNHGNDLSSDII